MSERYPGGIISKTAPTVSANPPSAPGVWTLDQQAAYQKAGTWPFGGPFVYVEDVFSTYLYTGNGGTLTINNGIALGSTLASSLQGLPITAISFRSIYLYTLPYINDGQAPDNNTNVAYSDTTFDVYVTFPSAVTLTEYLLAPQGNVNTPYNTPTGFVVLASNDASTWVTVATFTSISTGYPAWNPGTYRTFPFSNTTAYKYWRLQCTGSGSGSAGNSIAEWRVTGTTSVIGNGGLVWIKRRDATVAHGLWDTARGAGTGVTNATNKALATNTTSAEGLGGLYPGENIDYLSQFTSSGFTVNSNALGGRAIADGNNATYASWTFRKQPKFFDVLTASVAAYPTLTTINHSLGSTPGCIMMKQTNSTSDWVVWHTSVGNNNLVLNDTGAAGSAYAGYVLNVNSTSFQVYAPGTAGTYVFYIFAHNAGGFGAAGADNVISCGSFTTDGSGNATVNLGYEPQWVMFKASSTISNWYLLDNMRGLNAVYDLGGAIFPNLASSETTFDPLQITATGFNVKSASNPSTTYIYIAIRRGPMRTPTTGTSVFEPIAKAGTGTDTNINTPYGFPADLIFTRQRANLQDMGVFDRLRGNFITLYTDSTGAEGTSTGAISFANSEGFVVGSDTGSNICNQAGYEYIQETFGRAPGFMDMVCYTGTGANTNFNHNLTVVPEMMIFKRRNAAGSWLTYHKDVGNDYSLTLDTTGAKSYSPTTFLNGTSPTASVFTVGIATSINFSGSTYIAYLFASCPGVSKVGSYSGTGATQTISCGFAARFVLIKRTDDVGSWWIWDTTRGMIAGTDPRLALNNNATETNTNWVYTDASGFQIVTTDATVNASGGSYIYLAIA